MHSPCFCPFFPFSIPCVVFSKEEAQWPIGYGVGLRIKRSSVRIRPWPLRWVLGQGSLLPLSQGEAFTLASISYLAILVKYILAKKKKKKKEREKVWRGTPWWKLQPYCCRGFGRAKPRDQRCNASSASGSVGLRPLQGSKQASNLYFKIFQSLKGFIGSDLNEVTPNHPANSDMRASQTSGYTTDIPLSLSLSFYSSSYYL